MLKNKYHYASYNSCFQFLIKNVQNIDQFKPNNLPW